MLVDDNIHDIFFHERTIWKNNSANNIVAKQTGEAALQYLKEEIAHKNAPPDLLFLDINMPRMNGWEFLEEYEKLDKEFKSKTVVVVLTTSSNDDEGEKAKALNCISDFKTKPLTTLMLDEIIDKYL